jgi:PAS domain S-box-containing protein
LDVAAELERERLEAILDSAHIGIGFLDSDLRFLQANEALARMNGIPVREHLGRRILDVAPWSSERKLDLAPRARQQTSIGIGSHRRSPPQGRSQPRRVVLPLRVAGGDVIGVGFTVNDVPL